MSVCAIVFRKKMSAVWGTLSSLFDERKRFQLSKASLTIGRSSKNVIQIDDPCVSSVHLKICWDDKTRRVSVLDLSTNGTWLDSKKMKRKKLTFVKSGTEVCIKNVAPGRNVPVPRISFLLECNENEDEDEGVKRRLNHYRIGKSLGSGAFATVFLATHKDSGRKFAMKVVEKKKFAMMRTGLKTSSDAAMREVEILQKCSHPNIVKCHAVFDTRKKLYILLDLVTGGELFERIVENGAFEESSARDIFRQLVHAVAYLHSRGISHRDLKPENILLEQVSSSRSSTASSKGGDPHEDGLIVKVSDFGMSRLMQGHQMTTMAGTPHYVAPEVLTNSRNGKGYGKEVDMWSLGVVLYVLLSAQLPFGDASSGMSVFDQVQRSEIVFAHHAFGNVSRDAIDLIRKLLVRDPSTRLNATEVLVHPWLTKSTTLQSVTPDYVMRRWRNSKLAASWSTWQEHATLKPMSPSSSDHREVRPPSKRQRETGALSEASETIAVTTREKRRRYTRVSQSRERRRSTRLRKRK